MRVEFLRRRLDSFLLDFPRDRHVLNDPVRYVHHYSSHRDREVMGFIAAAFAYGNVKIVLRTVGDIVARMGSSPSEFVAAFDPARDLGQLDRFYHRFNTARDLGVLLWILRRTLEEFGSLECAFMQGMKPGDTDSGPGIERLSDLFLSFGHERFYPRGELKHRRGVLYFFPKPSTGSACKRTNLFLRWMIRPADGIDCGVWRQVPASKLVIPLDTHIARISQYIGLTSYRSGGWAMALDITKSLLQLDVDDPLRYDFALCHLGIAGDCPKKRQIEKCRRCPIQAICRL